MISAVRCCDTSIIRGRCSPLQPHLPLGLTNRHLRNAWYNVTIDRLWRDDDETNEGGEVIKKGEWHQSQSFGRDDLLLVAKVADSCHSWVYRRIQDQTPEQSF